MLRTAATPKPAPTSDVEGLPESFKKDALLSQFLKEDFEASAFTSELMKTAGSDHGEALSATQKKLVAGLEQLDFKLHQQVSSHTEELIDQVSAIGQLETILTQVKESVSSLESSITDIKGQLAEPFAVVESKTMQMDRMVTTTRLLRSIIRFLYLVKTLKEHRAGGDIVKASRCLYELEQMRKDGKFAGIEVVENHVESCVQMLEAIRNESAALFVRGMETQNQSSVSSALHVYYELHTLDTHINDTLARQTKMTHASIKEAMDIHSILQEARSIKPSAMEGGVQWKTALWQRITKLIGTLHDSCVQVWHLQLVLSKMLLHGSHGRMIPIRDAIPRGDEYNIYKPFWNETMRVLKNRLNACADQSAVFDKALVGEYPKLLRMVKDFLRRLKTHYDIQYVEEGGASHDREEKLMGTLHRFERSYLSRSLSRVQQSVTSAFRRASSSATVPSKEDVIEILRIITAELRVSKSDGRLDAQVRKCICKALKTFSLEMEKKCPSKNAIKSSKSTEWTLTSAHKQSIVAFNALNALKRGAEVVLIEGTNDQSVKSSSRSTTSSVGSVDDLERGVLKELEDACKSQLQFVFSHVTRVGEALLLKMHSNGSSLSGPRGECAGLYGAEELPARLECSPFMKDLTSLMEKFASTAIHRYSNSEYVDSERRSCSAHMARYFMRNAALVRPISSGGRLLMAADMAQLEIALAPVHELSRLGASYAELRALRALVFRQPEEVLGCAEVDVLPPGLVLHYLFGYAPMELESPHLKAGWNVAKYNRWLDTHSDGDVWRVIKSSLEAYAALVNERGDVAFHPIYPIFLKLGPDLLERYRTRRRGGV